MKTTKRGIATASALALTVLAGACGYQRTDADQWGCSFGDGPWDSRDLKGTLEPGERGDLSNDRVVVGPASVRTYVLDEDTTVADYGARPLSLIAKGRDLDLDADASGEEAEAVRRLSSTVGNVPVSVELQSRFVINERFCELYVSNLRTFDEGEVGLGFNAPQGSPSGWAQFLNLSWNQKMVEAARPVVFEYDWLTLNTNGVVELDGERGNIFDILGERISENLTRELSADLGNNFFCGPSYSFDGTIDGELENGCPSIEVTVKEIRPTGTKGDQLLADYQAIVANAERAQKVLSDKDLQITELNAQRDAELATEANRRQTELEKAANDKLIADAQREAREAEAELKAVDLEAARAGEIEACRALADVGVDCAWYEAAKQGALPRVIVGDGDGAGVLLDVGAGN